MLSLCAREHDQHSIHMTQYFLITNPVQLHTAFTPKRHASRRAHGHGSREVVLGADAVILQPFGTRRRRARCCISLGARHEKLRTLLWQSPVTLLTRLCGRRFMVQTDMHSRPPFHQRHNLRRGIVQTQCEHAPWTPDALLQIHACRHQTVDRDLAPGRSGQDFTAETRRITTYRSIMLDRCFLRER